MASAMRSAVAIEQSTAFPADSGCCEKGSVAEKKQCTSMKPDVCSSARSAGMGWTDTVTFPPSLSTEKLLLRSLGTTEGGEEGEGERGRRLGKGRCYEHALAYP